MNVGVGIAAVIQLVQALTPGTLLAMADCRGWGVGGAPHPHHKFCISNRVSCEARGRGRKEGPGTCKALTFLSNQNLPCLLPGLVGQRGESLGSVRGDGVNLALRCGRGGGDGESRGGARPPQTQPRGRLVRNKGIFSPTTHTQAAPR